MATEQVQPKAGEVENIAATLARVLPQANIVHLARRGAVDGSDFEQVAHIAMPHGVTLQKIDLENLLPNPRRTVASAQFDQHESFIDYINHHRQNGTTVWCQFNAKTFALQFVGVLDDHGAFQAGWRAHQAGFKPELSIEWQAWLTKNKAWMTQVEFAEWLEEHEDDIAESNSMPTLLQIKSMASNFVARQDMLVKSAIRLQDGGVNLTYINEADSETIETMRVFERFGVAIPVFYGATDRWQITARLKYKTGGGKVQFQYDLMRPDRVHQAAAEELIRKIRDGINDVPLRYGICK